MATPTAQKEDDEGVKEPDIDGTAAGRKATDCAPHLATSSSSKNQVGEDATTTNQNDVAVAETLESQIAASQESIREEEEANGAAFQESLNKKDAELAALQERKQMQYDELAALKERYVASAARTAMFDIFAARGAFVKLTDATSIWQMTRLEEGQIKVVCNTKTGTLTTTAPGPSLSPRHSSSFMAARASSTCSLDKLLQPIDVDDKTLQKLPSRFLLIPGSDGDGRSTKESAEPSQILAASCFSQAHVVSYVSYILEDFALLLDVVQFVNNLKMAG